MIAGWTLLGALLFGTADQYLGSVSAHPWGADVSLLSAPWLLLPFVAGLLQHRARGAAAWGWAATLAALVGYGVMTLSPVENAHLGVDTVLAFLHSEARVFCAGMVTGPLFGYLGYWWRGRRALPSALIVSGALCLEPVARLLTGDAIRSPIVAWAEAAVGAVLAVVLVLRPRAAPEIP